MDLRTQLIGLFAERDRIAELLTQYRYAGFTADLARRKSVEGEIAEFVLQPLALTPAETPTPAGLTEAAARLKQLGFPEWGLIRPCGSSTERWPASLKQRLNEVAGSVEAHLRNLFAEEANAIA